MLGPLYHGVARRSRNGSFVGGPILAESGRAERPDSVMKTRAAIRERWPSYARSGSGPVVKYVMGNTLSRSCRATVAWQLPRMRWMFAPPIHELPGVHASLGLKRVAEELPQTTCSAPELDGAYVRVGQRYLHMARGDGWHRRGETTRIVLNGAMRSVVPVDYIIPLAIGAPKGVSVFLDIGPRGRAPTSNFTPPSKVPRPETYGVQYLGRSMYSDRYLLNQKDLPPAMLLCDANLFIPARQSPLCREEETILPEATLTVVFPENIYSVSDWSACRSSALGAVRNRLQVRR